MYNLPLGRSVISEMESNQIIGWIGMGKPSPGKEQFGDLDFGYALARDSWGKGFMTEALKGLLDFAFTKLQANSVFGECEVENIGSAQVMEKAGMRFQTRLHEPPLELFRYTITKAQWAANP